MRPRHIPDRVGHSRLGQLQPVRARVVSDRARASLGEQLQPVRARHLLHRARRRASSAASCDQVATQISFVSSTETTAGVETTTEGDKPTSTSVATTDSSYRSTSTSFVSSTETTTRVEATTEVQYVLFTHSVDQSTSTRVQTSANASAETSAAQTTSSVPYPACKAGFYCPPGTFEPIACSPGTFQTGLGMIAQTNCTRCRAGTFSTGSGMGSRGPLAAYVGPAPFKRDAQLLAVPFGRQQRAQPGDWRRVRSAWRRPKASACRFACWLMPSPLGPTGSGRPSFRASPRRWRRFSTSQSFGPSRSLWRALAPDAWRRTHVRKHPPTA